VFYGKSARETAENIFIWHFDRMLQAGGGHHSNVKIVEWKGNLLHYQLGNSFFICYCIELHVGNSCAYEKTSTTITIAI
jgi:hypothetical protein